MQFRVCTLTEIKKNPKHTNHPTDFRKKDPWQRCGARVVQALRKTDRTSQAWDTMKFCVTMTAAMLADGLVLIVGVQCWVAKWVASSLTTSRGMWVRF